MDKLTANKKRVTRVKTLEKSPVLLKNAVVLPFEIHFKIFKTVKIGLIESHR